MRICVVSPQTNCMPQNVPLVPQGHESPILAESSIEDIYTPNDLDEPRVGVDNHLMYRSGRLNATGAWRGLVELPGRSGKCF